MRRQLKFPKTDYGWWRFDGYEIRDAVIRPAPGSRLTWYDPWVDFQQARNQTNGQPAYSELARLVQTLRADPATKGNISRLSQESQSQILAWCGRHGLLGVFLSRWESVTLWPCPDATDPTLSIQTSYFRSYGGRIVVHQAKGDLHQASRVFIHPLNDVSITEEKLSDTWHRFFPSVPQRERETYGYPPPYSQAFWELYSEPIYEFWRAARLFSGIVEHLGHPSKGIARRAPASRGNEALAREQAIESVNILRRHVSQVLVDESEGLRQEWVSPSLLASFAEMFVQDIVAGKRAQYCECCGSQFMTQAYQAHYCGRTCRLRQQKRNLRAHMKQARASYVAGRSIRQIAERLGDPYEIVQRWVSGLQRGRERRPS
jgi:hypothetical protein